MIEANPKARVPVDALRQQAEAILLAYGATPEEAKIG